VKRLLVLARWRGVAQAATALSGLLCVWFVREARLFGWPVACFAGATMNTSSRLASPALVASFLGLTLAAACGGATSLSTDGTSSPAASDGLTPPSPSGAPSGAPSAGGTASASQPVGADTATRFELASGVCGGACTSCQGESVRVVDFAAGTFEDHRCVELDDKGAPADGSTLPVVPPGATERFTFACLGGISRRADAITRTSLTPSQVSSLRSALGGVRYAAGKLEALDGKMWSVTVEGPQGKLAMSPSAACGPSSYDQIVAGFEPLWSAVDAL
jgi:hypothetical protein